MRRRLGIVAALCAVAACIALNARSVQAEGIRTFLMGDSFAVGMAPMFGADQTIAMIGASVHYRWESVPHIDKGTRVVLVLGTNDAVEVGDEGIANYEWRVREIARKLADRAYEVIWVGPPCILPGHIHIDDEHLRELTDIQREAVIGLNRPNLKWVSLRALTERDGNCAEDDRTEDQVHFTAAGYARIVRAIRSAAGIPAY